MKLALLATGIKELIPTILLITGGVIALVAFLIGFVKGFRRVSWFGVVWFVSEVAFALVQKFLGSKVAKLLAPIAKKCKLRPETTEAIPAIVLAVATVLALALLYGIARLIFRPRYAYGDERLARYLKDDPTVYDDDYDDYGRNGGSRRKIRKPSVFGRLLGGGICLFNAVMLVSVIAFGLLLFVEPTKLKTGFLAPVYELKAIKTILPYMNKYLLDAVIVGIMLWTVCRGYRVGFAEIVRILVTRIGALAGVVLSFVIPFTKFGTRGWFGTYTYKCAHIVSSFGIKNAKVVGIGGQILAGLGVALCVIVVAILLNILLKLLVRGIRGVGVFRGVDGALSSLVFVVIGLVIAIAILAVAAVIRYYFFSELGAALAFENSLAESIYEGCKEYLFPLLKK